MRFVVAAIAIAMLSFWAFAHLEAGSASAGLIDPFEDSDMDGCTTAEELGPDPSLGGLRDPNDPWDFYDTNLDGFVDLPNDILGVILAFGQGPGGSQYTVGKDRGPGMTAPDGTIDLPNDILGVILQYGNTCTSREWCDGDVKDGAARSTEYFEADAGEFWQDCFTLYNDDGLVIDHLIREASVDYSVEMMTQAEIEEEFGITLPESILRAGGPDEWAVETCSGDLIGRNRLGAELTRLDVSQTFITTQFTNIVWPPEPGFASADANYLWTVDNDPEPRPVPYPILYYDLPNNIIGMGETFASARFELNVGAFGVSLTLQTATDNLYLEFGEGWCRETRSLGFGY